MSIPIVTHDQHKVNLADPAAGGSSPTDPTQETSNTWQFTRPALAPEPPAASFDSEEKARYRDALELVRRIDADLLNNHRCHYRRGGRLLHTLDEVVRAILDNNLEETDE